MPWRNIRAESGCSIDACWTVSFPKPNLENNEQTLLLIPSHQEPPSPGEKMSPCRASWCERTDSGGRVTGAWPKLGCRTILRERRATSNGGYAARCGNSRQQRGRKFRQWAKEGAGAPRCAGLASCQAQTALRRRSGKFPIEHLVPPSSADAIGQGRPATPFNLKNPAEKLDRSMQNQKYGVTPFRAPCAPAFSTRGDGCRNLQQSGVDILSLAPFRSEVRCSFV